ncbi:MAG TPA: thioredoxin family protein [Streptosporangiaceae bacterium]
MTLRIPLYLAIAQWALLGALGVLVIVLFRQLGRLLRGTATAAELGPVIGSRAAGLSYLRPGEQVPRKLAPGTGQPALIAFVDPTCPSCEQLVLTLDQLQAAGDLAAVRVLLLISDPASYLQISEAFSATELEIGRPSDPAGLESYRVTGTPLLVAVDASGMVTATGSAIRAAEVRRYIQASLGSTQAPAVAPAAVVRGEGTA